MIGLALHLGQRALDGLVDRLLPLPVSLALGLCRETSDVERLGAECDQLRDERDRARASLRELGGLLSGIARRMTDDEAELALVEMAEAGARLARGEAAAKALVELRAAAADLVAARDRLRAAEDAAEAIGEPLPLAPWIEAQEAWDRMGKALPPGATP